MGKFFHKPSADQRDLVPPGQHLAKGFPVLTYGETPQVARADWHLQVWGLAAPTRLAWDDMMTLPQSEFVEDFHCVTHWSKLGVQWAGVKVTDLMQQISMEPSATHVLVHCYGGYTTNLTLEDFCRPTTFLAHTLSGEPLPPERGGPLRLVVPHLYAWKSAKWVEGFEFLAKEVLGFWETNGYHRRGDPWATERYS